MIKADCPNGHRLRLPDKYAAKKIRCPKCEAVVRVPDLPNDDNIYDELIEEDVSKEERRRVAAAKRKAEAAKVSEPVPSRKSPFPKWAVVVSGGLTGFLLTSLVGWFLLLRTQG